MYQTSKKKTKKKDSRFNNLYILKLNQVDDKHQEWVENSKVRKPDFRTSGMGTTGPSSWSAGPSLVGASPGRPSCPLLHCLIPKRNTAWNTRRPTQIHNVGYMVNNCWAESTRPSQITETRHHLSWLSVLLHCLVFLSVCSHSGATLLLLVLLVLLVFLLFLVFLFLLLLLFLSAAVNIWILQ